MTVCIAALCQAEGVPTAVVAADRMVTYGGFIEFEHRMPKMGAPTPSAVAMVSGDSLVGTRLSFDVAASVSGTNPRLSDIAQRLAQQYVAVRRQSIEQQFLIPRGLDFNSFYGAHSSLSPQITMMVDQQMSQFNLGVELLLAGVDPSGAHIYSIHNPGVERLHDIIGYAAVGSGTIHALQSLIGFGHSAQADYHETVFRVYASKRRAEVAPGVGRDTDMAVISPAGIHVLTPEELDQLRDIFDDFEQATGNELQARLASFQLGAPTPASQVPTAGGAPGATLQPEPSEDEADGADQREGGADSGTSEPVAGMDAGDRPGAAGTAPPA